MKFCMQCGAELSEEAKYCRSCGAKVNSAKTHGNAKAPDTEGDIKVPDTEVNVKAPDTDGEFVLASWDAPAPRDTAVRHEEKPKKEVEPRAKEEPQAKEESPAKEKKQGCLSYLFLYAKVIFIADSVSEETARTIKKKSATKNYKFGLHGYSNLLTGVTSLGTEKTVTNSAGHELVPYFKKLFAARA